MEAGEYADVFLETEDLVLRKAVFSDWDALYRNITRHPEAARYMLWSPDENEEMARERMRRTLAFEAREKYAFLVCLKKTGEPIGFAAMRQAEEGAFEDMGIALGPAFHRRGYGRQILEAFCEEARRCGAKEFRSSYRLANMPSQRLQEACGFVFDFDSEERTDPRTGERYIVRNMKKAL